MISIHTNLSSLVVQNNLSKSTNGINQAIERMSTGYKINHASDNAANYSIATEMTSKINSCNVAQDNIGMGMNLVSVAQETVSQMQSRASKLHALITQARNGTYGETSLNAINLEAAALVAEIDRAYNNAEYDGIGMIQKFKPEIPDGVGLTSELKPRDDGFLVNPKTYDDAAVNAMTHVKEIDTFESGVTYAIGDLEDLIKFRTIVNGGKNGAGSTFVMCDDIDMSSIDNWGEGIKVFSGTFDGNGHVISNFKQTLNTNSYSSGLFRSTSSCIIKNLGLTNAQVNVIKSSDYSGILVGNMKGTIMNCFVKGNIEANEGVNIVGGFVGRVHQAVVKDCYFEGNVTGSASSVGGLCGSIYESLKATNCYVKGNISGKNYIGGIVGSQNYGGYITNCSFNGNVSGISCVGGLFGAHTDTNQIYMGGNYIYNCEVSGSISGRDSVAGIVGYATYTKGYAQITGTLCKANVSGDYTVGGFIGFVDGGCSLMQNCMSIGNVSGNANVGGIFGIINMTTLTNGKSSTVNNVSFYGDLTGGSRTGGVAGMIANTADGETFRTLNFVNCKILENDYDTFGGTYKYNGSYTRIEYDTTTWENNINIEKPLSTKITLQAGLDSAGSSQIKFDLGFDYDLTDIITEGCASDGAYTAINTFINTLSRKETEFGAISNKLDSALESVTVSMDNLVSSRSTILDADMSKVSSQYIRQQILQQACATLMSTANQNPAIALQLL